MKVGFLGLGNMGMPMATNLLKKGFELHVYNRTRSKTETLAAQGAKVAASPSDLTRQVEAVLACLADVPASREALLGENGVLAAARAGQIVADLSTVDLETSRQCHHAARGRGVHFLDAPVSGGPEGAQAGTLVFLVGGDEEAFQKARTLFQALGRSVEYMGPSGAGTAAKLVNQLLVGVHTLASCEALLLAAKAGMDLEKLTAVLMQAWGASKMLERNAPLLSRRHFSPSAAPVRNLAKDLHLILELGKNMGLSLPATEQAERMSRMATDRGFALHDITVIGRLLEQKAESSG